jgi:hypothetical protein
MRWLKFQHIQLKKESEVKEKIGREAQGVLTHIKLHQGGNHEYGGNSHETSLCRLYHRQW